jgi:bleomycin resistance family protein
MGQTGEGLKHQKPSVSETKVAMMLEVQMIPVSDVERSKQFYERMGWRSDAGYIIEVGQSKPGFAYG